MVGVLRLLHRKPNQIVAGDIDVGGHDRIQFPGQVARKNRAVHRLVAQFDANLGAIAIDELGGVLATHQGHVVTGHQKLCPQQGAVGGSEDQNVARHALSFS
jgi:hypothetical protein